MNRGRDRNMAVLGRLQRLDRDRKLAELAERETARAESETRYQETVNREDRILHLQGRIVTDTVQLDAGRYQALVDTHTNASRESGLAGERLKARERSTDEARDALAEAWRRGEAVRRADERGRREARKIDQRRADVEPAPQRRREG